MKANIEVKQINIFHVILLVLCISYCFLHTIIIKEGLFIIEKYDEITPKKVYEQKKEQRQTCFDKLVSF